MAAGEKLLRSLVAMAAADGRIGKRELKLIDNYRAKWGLSPEVLERCVDEVEAGNTKVTLPKDAKSRKVFLKALVKIAAVDGVIEPGERTMLRSVAAKMEVADDALEAMIQRALSKVDSDARVRVSSDPKLEAADEPLQLAPAPGPVEGLPEAPPDADELLAFIAYKQARGEHVPPELLELAALLHLAQQAQGGGYGGGYGGVSYDGVPLTPREPGFIDKLSTGQRAAALGIFAALWLIAPVVTGIIGGSNAVSAAEDRAERIAAPTAQRVEGARGMHQANTRAARDEQRKLAQELELVRKEAAKAKEAPERLRQFSALRAKRWETFEREFPRGPKR